MDSNLKKEERFELIKSVKTPRYVFEYVEDKLKKLTIEILNKNAENVIELMNKGLLEGWCWQTTESVIVFLEDNDCIERGNLKFERDSQYWHSWICFQLKNKEFIFDPCLRILVESCFYREIFEVSVKGTVTKQKVEKDLIARISNHKKKEYSCRFMEEDLSERQKTEIYVCENGDINSPMYRNNTGYKAIIENGRIKELNAHYYVVFSEFS